LIDEVLGWREQDMQGFAEDTEPWGYWKLFNHSAQDMQAVLKNVTPLALGCVDMMTSKSPAQGCTR